MAEPVVPVTNARYALTAKINRTDGNNFTGTYSGQSFEFRGKGTGTTRYGFKDVNKADGTVLHAGNMTGVSRYGHPGSEIYFFPEDEWNINEISDDPKPVDGGKRRYRRRKIQRKTRKPKRRTTRRTRNHH